jgi:oligopeptidase B
MNFTWKSTGLSLILLTMGVIMQSCNQGTLPAVPVAKKVPHETNIHGVTLMDNYFWIRDKSNPEVKAYLEAENTYADAAMASTRKLQDALYHEILSHIKETDVRVPYREGEFFYYSRTEQGKQYPIFCRKKGSLEAAEAIILDQNELAKGEKFMGLAVMTVSEDGNLLAYSTDNTGFRQYKLHIRDLRTGKDFPEVMEKTGSVAWASDNQTLFYTVEDSAKRQYRLYRHRVGTEASGDVLIQEEKDERFDLIVEKSLSRKYLFLLSHSHTTSEMHYVPADRPSGEWKLLAPRVPEQEYYAEHRGDLFYIRTNKDGRTFSIYTTPVRQPDRKNWKELIPLRSDVMLEGQDLFANYLVLWERKNGLQQIRIRDLRDDKERQVAFPDAAYTLYPGANRVWDATKIRYHYQSPITPESVFDFDILKNESTLLKQQEIPGGFDRNNYQLERLFAVAPDGIKVPITVVYRNSVKRDGTAPLHLYGYGSYGYPNDPTFSSSRLALLDRGLVVALGHIRGGGDLGKAWHDAGRMDKKMNTFTDFIAIAEYLVKEKYAARTRIAIEGGSAGGLLMGAVTNLRPDLWKAVVSHVPFVDVINTMLDASLPLTVGEYEEWGNPNKKEEFEWMRKYSPYDNLQAKAYPAMLVKTSFNDSQVMYWEPAKYVAKLRTLKTDHNLLLLKTNMDAGHGGSSGRYDHLREIAYDFAFILTQLGIEK